MDPAALQVIEQAPDLDHLNLAVIDVETSGLSPEDHHLLQVAVIVIDGKGRVRQRWTSDIRPPRGVFGDVGPTEIHGLTRRRLWRAPRLPHVMRQLQPLLADAVVAGHNVHFDQSFLGEASRRTGVPLPPMASLCTLELSRRLDPQRQRRHRLGDLCEYYGIALDRPHDALADAEATATLLARLFQELDVRRPADVAELVRSQWSAS